MEPAVNAFKERYLGRTDVILHEYDIRKARGPFAILLNGDTRERFMLDLNRLITDAPSASLPPPSTSGNW